MAGTSRHHLLRKALTQRILVLDGAMGTALQARNLSPKDFGGDEFDGCNENLNLTRADIIADIHREYFDAGADIVETNTFGGTPLVLAEYGLESKAYEINRVSAEIACSVSHEYDLKTPDCPRFVAGSMGPTTKAMSVTGGVTFEALADHYYEQARGLLAGGVDYFLLETCQDTRNVKAGISALHRLFADVKMERPIALSCTIEPTGTMLAGQTVEAFWASVEHIEPLYIGLNCATGPEFMTDALRSLSNISRSATACVPNAGLPDESGCYLETPETMVKVLERFAQEGWMNVLGGCCGTTAKHIAKFVEMARKHRPRSPSKRTFSFLSGIDYLELAPENRPILVGERTNVIGSRKFKGLVEKEQFEAGAEIARAQIRKGAQVVDVCLANPDRDELEDMRRFLEQAVKMIRVPLMIDTTDDRVVSMALTYSQGKAIVNSINLEDGEERFERVVPLAQAFGAAVVVGCIDDDPQQGMAITRDRKVAVARRSYDILTTKHRVAPEDIYWDALVFPCASGDSQYVGSALETIEGVRLLKKEFPGTKTILGISNVSFGLPTSGREVLNSVFLYHCTQAGLDLAIVNAEQLRRYPSLSEEERTLAENLLFNRGEKSIERFADHFRGKKVVSSAERESRPLDERLASYIIEGTKEGLKVDLDRALKKSPPLEIINGPLMRGMDEVGRLFNKNELIVAEVLQSAEAMKAAVAHLEPYMEKSASASRGKILLATVKGDVHDIGKNLVEIILSNNGFEVINLGIKVAPETLINAVREHHPQIIGLSGLLVKSAQQMVITADDLSQAGINVPLLVGGAALTRGFTDRNIAKAYRGTVIYASDAMNGLDLAKIVVNPKELENFLAKRTSETPHVVTATSKPAVSEKGRRSEIRPIVPPPSPPDFERHVLANVSVDEIWTYINPRMLLGRHLGLSNSQIASLSDPKAKEVVAAVDEVKAICRRDRLLDPRAVYQFFRASGKDDAIAVEDFTLTFPRQTEEPYLCLADYVGPDDALALFVVTAGQGVRERAETWKNEGKYLNSHILSALALETAEAFAEWLHHRIRGIWGFPDPAGQPRQEMFKAHYHGKRYSYGYPACPDLAEQRKLFELLKAESIGVTLTEGDMMDPEASVSAIVLHHPEAVYFAT